MVYRRRGEVYPHVLCLFFLKDDLRVEILSSHEHSKGRGSKWSGPREVHADFVTKQSVRDIRVVGGIQFKWEKRWKGVIELNTSNKHLSFPPLFVCGGCWVVWHVCTRERGKVSWVIGIRQMPRC